jgi:hypothetical protein
MFIPCYRYITADGINGAVSLSHLVNNYFDIARDFLFGADADKIDERTIAFCKYILGFIIATVSLFALGVISVIYTTVSAISYCGGKRNTTARALFITLVPNRFVLCIYNALLLPIFFFPMSLPKIFDGMLAEHIEIMCEPFDMMFIALGLYLLNIIFIFLTARMEMLEDMDVFYKQKKVKGFAEEYEDDEEEEELTDEYEKMDKRAKDEQTERILRLLNKNKDIQDNEEDK